MVKVKKEEGATFELIDISQIKDDVIVLKSGGLRKILLTSGVNFDLQAEEEKEAIIAGFQDFLNSLNFSIQIIIHSRKLNISGYLKQIERRFEQERSPLLKEMITSYKGFIGDFVSQNPIMSKTFFIAVPFDPISIPQAGKALFRFFKKNKNKEKQQQQSEHDVKSFVQNAQKLDSRVAEVVDGLNLFGLRAVPLVENEIIELLYNFYNPEPVEKQL